MRLVEAITAQNALSINLLTQGDTICHIIFTYNDGFRKQYLKWLFWSDNYRISCFRRFPQIHFNLHSFWSSVEMPKLQNRSEWSNGLHATEHSIWAELRLSFDQHDEICENSFQCIFASISLYSLRRVLGQLSQLGSKLRHIYTGLE